MAKLGAWEVNISTNYPQKVATAISKLGETLLGAEYEPILYLGSQVVKGTNHAVLAQQTVLSGKDTKNAVILIFNEEPSTVEATLVSIERVVESGGELGGIVVDMTTNIPNDAKMELTNVLDGIVGIDIKPVAYVGSQVVKGTNQIFVAEVTAVVPNPTKRVALVVANSLTGELSMTDLLDTKFNSMNLGYAFTWLKRQNTSLGAPLGEWP